MSTDRYLMQRPEGHAGVWCQGDGRIGGMRYRQAGRHYEEVTAQRRPSAACGD